MQNHNRWKKNKHYGNCWMARPYPLPTMQNGFSLNLSSKFSQKNWQAKEYDVWMKTEKVNIE